MTESINKNTNEIIKNVQLRWTKLDTPTENYSGDKMIYDTVVVVPKARADELAKYRKVRNADKDSDAFVCINLSKNAFKKDGSEAAKVRVVDQNKLPLDPKLIGNGSVANVIVMRSPYSIKNPKTGKVTKEGVSTMLVAVQITKLVKYEPKSSMDFDVVDTDGNDAEAYNDQF